MGFDYCADIVLFDGKVVTVDRNDSIAEAVAVRDGKIIKVGASEDIKTLVGEKTKVVDLEGRTVVPGMIDVHFHLDLLASEKRLNLNIQIPPHKSLEEIMELIRKKVQETPKREWIIARGRAELQPYPSKEEIDKLTPDNPMVINISGHRLRLNAKALEMAEGGKITKNSPTDEELQKLASGGRIQRNPKTGEPTGITDDAWDYIFRGPPYPYEELKEAIKKTCHELVQYGITSIHDLTCWSVSRWIYQDLLRDGELPLRIQFLPCVWGLGKSADIDCLLQLGLKSGFGNEWIKFGGIKIFVDAQHPPHLRLTREKLIDLLIKANKGGMRAVLHAVTRKGTKMAIGAIQTALKEVPVKDHRHRIDHFGSHSLVSQEDIEKVESLGIIPGPQLYCVYYGESVITEKKRSYLFKGMPRDMGDTGESLLGPFIFGYFIRKGLKVPGSSDSTGMDTAANPWWSLWCAVNRKNYKGELVFPEDKIRVMEGIRAYTINSAYAGFEEGIKGSIEEGKLADLVILAEDPLTIPVDRIKDIKVDMTIVGGRIVYCRK